VYQVGINKGIILRCTGYQISRSTNIVCISSRLLYFTYINLYGCVFEKCIHC